MIAPLRDVDETTTAERRQLVRARQMVADSLLRGDRDSDGATVQISAWRAWLLSAWSVLVVVVYLGHMAHLW